MALTNNGLGAIVPVAASGDTVITGTTVVNNKNVFIDTKRKLGEWIENADYIKINSLEYEQNEDFFKIYDHVFKKT